MDRGVAPPIVPRPEPPAGVWRRPRVRLTTRRLLIVVAAAGACLGVGRRVVEELRGPYFAGESIERSFALGPESWVAVDLCSGPIEVFPSRTGETTIKVAASAEARTRADAERSFKAMTVAVDGQGDTLRVVVREAPGLGGIPRAYAALYVTPGVHLDLRTGEGDVDVGPDFHDTTYAPGAVVAHSIRVRNDSALGVEGHPGHFLINDFEGSGNITVNARGPTRPEASRPDPVRLQLDACGQITVKAERAAFETRVWHSGRSHADYGGWHGGFDFEGTLAEGDHHVRAVHRADIRLTGEPSHRINAAVRGRSPGFGSSIEGNIPNAPIEAAGPEARWEGTLGSGAGGTLTVRVDDGSILLDRKP